VRATTLLFAVLALTTLSSAASAQCYYLSPPRAPDLYYPATYCANNPALGYGHYQSVLPPFPPFQGAIFPSMAGMGGGGGGGGGFGGAGAGAGGSPFGTHPFARGPRDFFMYEGGGPIQSPYRYGPVSPIGPVGPLAEPRVTDAAP
jgi:hypothetical protein